MPINEQVVISVSQRGIQAVDREIDKLGKTSFSAGKAVAGIVAALASLAAVRGLTNIAKEAVAASAAFEGYGVQLRALLGSQEEANKALDNFVTLAAKTPFAVSDIVQGSTALAAAALGNRERLEELTQTAANLAAVSGLSFRESASNLARSLSAGIGAADLFRERGVRALIESIGGIPDATKLSAAELDKAFSDIFGKFGTFGDAAENLSLTLGGALSNIGDASQNFKVALGDALSPVVINAARNLFIPFFQNLQALVAANADNIAEFAAGALSALVRGLVLAGEAGLSFTSGLASARQFIITLTGALFEAQLQIAEFDLALNKLAANLGLVSDAELGFQQAEIDKLRAGVDAIAEDVGAAGRETDKFKAGLDALASSLGNLRQLASTTNLTAAIETPTAGPSAEELTANTRVDAKEAKEAAAAERERVRAREDLLDLVRSQRLEQASLISEEERRKILIDEEIAQATTLGRIAQDEALAQQVINELIKERASLGTNKFAEGLSTDVAEGFQRGFENAIRNGTDLFQNLQDQFASLANEALIEGFQGGFDALQKGLESTFQAVAGTLTETFGPALGKLGPILGDVLAGALQFVALQGLSALFGGGGNSSSSSVGNVTSAVTSTQAVRGIVAGPQEIAIAQVDRAIGEAMAPATEELRTQTGILREIVAVLQSSGGGALDPDSQALAFGSAPAAAI